MQKRPLLFVLALMLLRAAVGEAQIVASGKTLTVTTTNAVATFNGPDLVGFTNALTGEQYLKKPSNGDLAVVDAMSNTGQSLQSSNWSVSAGVASITSQDSARTFTLTVTIDSASQEIVLHSSAGVTSGGVRGASWSIAGLDLAGGKWIVPANSGSVFDAGHPGIGALIAYPLSWQAQMAVYQGAAGSLLLYSTDTQIYFKDLHQTTRGDSMLDVAVYTEATAPWPSATTVPGVEWRLKAFTGDWRAAATPFRDWMIAAHPPLSNAAHPWVSNIRTVVEIGHNDTSLLAQLAAKVTPSQTLLYIPDWRQSAYDVNYPDYTPASGVAAFVTAAHGLGFKVMLHTDIVAAAPTNGDYAGVQQYQAKTPDTLQPIGQFWDQPSNPLRYGLIDPAASAFRSLWITRVTAAVNAVNPDALHLDFTAMYNDGNGPIEGRTYTQGEEFFNQQIVNAFPNLAIGGEEEFDFTYRYHSFAQADLFAFSAPGHPITPFLFSPQVFYYSNLTAPPPSDPSFKLHLLDMQRRTILPMWWVAGSSDLDTANIDNARFIGMVQSFQTHVFQPAWTADWTGALVRYQGLAGATAALTDDGRITALSTATPQSTLFQLAHDANQIATGSFVNRWPAFDNTTLYGLNPASLYFVDPIARPDATHATSLPQGVQLGSGTLVTPSFARVEIAPPVAFDFTNLSQARLGVRYQGADYPIGFGAVVQTQTNTVGGENRPSIFIHPPWQGQVGGETFAEYSVAVPSAAALRFSVGIDDGAGCTDGVTFRVTISGSEVWNQNFNKGAWHDVVLSLASYAGTTVPVRLISNPGPASNPSCDFGAWSKVAVAVPTSTISVPMQLASGSTFSGIDGASYSQTTSVSGTVTNVTVPGGFTIFTQAGTTVTSGTGLTTIPFDVWSTDQSGSLLKPGSVFNAGAVQSETSGGVTKNPAIWAHPPNAGRTVLSWALRLPASPLKLGWSAGVIDNAYSDDGVLFEVRINGLPYWSLVTGIHGDNHWTAGQLDLSRWQGQSILLELVSDSRSNNNADWAAWGDLVLSGSSVSCSYGVPATASVGALGGSSTANITATSTCSWSATSNVSWLTVVSGSSSGNGTVTYDVAPNLGAARSGTLTIAGSTLTVNQAAAPPPPPTTLNLSQDLVALGIAATNMTPNQPTLDAGPLFMQGVSYAVSHGIGHVVADKGAYYFLSLYNNGTHVQFGGNPITSDVSNMTIDLQGSDLIFTSTFQYGITLWYNTNLTLENFTIDYQPLPFTQLRVTAIDAAHAQIQYVVEPGWQDPSALNGAQTGNGAPPDEIHVFRSGRPAVLTQRMSASMPFSGNRLTIAPGYGFDPSPTNMTKIRVGDILVVAVRLSGIAIAPVHCRGCVFRNITLYSAPGAAMVDRDAEASVWERVYSVPKPGTDRLISTFGFGLQPDGANNQIRLSRAIRTLDGGFALYVWSTGDVESQQSARTLTVNGASGALGQGTTIANGSPVVFQRRSDGAFVASAVLVSQTGSVDVYNPNHLSYTFDRDLPGTVVGTVMYTTDPNQRGAGLIVERNNVQEKSCCMGMDIWGWVGGTIRGNYIHRVGYGGIGGIHSLRTDDWTTPPLVDMTFQNNVIDSTNLASDGWSLGGISTFAVGNSNGGSDLISGSFHHNITIANNLIADPGRAAVWLGNTYSSSVTGNLFLHPQERRDPSNAHPPQTDPTDAVVIDTTSSSITTTNNTVDSTSGVMFVTDTSYSGLAAYAPGSTMRLNAYNIGALVSPTATLTDADGVVMPMTIQNTLTHALDVQIPSAAALGGAYVTLMSGGTKYFGTLFIDSQDNLPAVNGCTYEASPSATSVASAGGSLSMLVATQAGCAYPVVDSDSFVAIGAVTTGTAVISVSVAANTGAARSTTIEIAGQPIAVTQPAVPAPTITLQPQSRTIASGQTATLSVTATSAGAMTYQWYVGASGNTANPVAGATASSFTTPALISTTSYWVRVSNPGGATDSASATISLGAPPVITNPPQSQRIASGQSATLTVAATGAGTLTYQWYTGTSGNTSNPIAGATSITYLTPALTSTTTYWVRVSNAYPPAANSATATITVGPVATDAIVANGKLLTVTTANAVATFTGADLVGFVNSLTNESYLVKPSAGDFAVVDLMSPTGQTLQISNWSVGTESGTGLPLATITAQDSARAFTMTVKIDPASQEIVLRTSAGTTSGGARGASWSVAGLNLAVGRWIVPASSGAVFDAANLGVGANIHYGSSWQAPMAVYEGSLGSMLLYSTDKQFFFKDLHQTSRGDSTLDVAVYTESTAPWPSATAVPAVEWRLKAFAGGWRAAAGPYRDWMTANFPPVSNAAHPWVSNIRTVVAAGGLDSTMLAPLAAQVDPAQTLLYLVNWRLADYDVNYPDYTPAAGAASFVSAAHALGFKVMLHTDIIGVAPENPDYAGVQQYQARTPDTLQLMGWNWNQPPSTPQRYGIISPASAAFRALWIQRIGTAITALHPDALHLDFTALYNDGNGLIEGHTYPQGEDLFNQQIIAAFPNVALGSEEEFEFTYRYHSFAQAGLWFESTGHPITNFLFSPQVEPYGHLSTPGVTDPAFKSVLRKQMQRGIFPMWWVYSPADLDTSNPDIARFIGMVQSFQTHAFQPAWAADWTGALVRYEGLAGSSATLTDTGQVMTLTATGSTLFQLAHDSDHATTGSFIGRWPAFDNTTLYGLDPTKLYFVDPMPRPDATHATSLPAGVQIGPGTLVSTSFAHFEVAPVTSSFDFLNLSNVHMGVLFQGVETPIGNGAAVNPATRVVGGTNRSGLLIRPPSQAQTGGETFAEYAVPVPAGATFQFSVGVPDDASCTDGVTFRVTANGTQLWQQNLARTGSRDVILSLSAFGGSTVGLRLISNPGPAGDPGCDAALWSGMTLSAAMNPISVPVTMATGSTFSGVDGAAYSPVSPTSGTVSNVSVPGAFTVFTQPGTAVSNGTNLANLPFEVWGAGGGEMARPGSVFGAGAVVSGVTAGGVPKTPAIWAHPPNLGATVLSWVLQLPNAAALKLGFSYGLGDGAQSFDGIDFSIRINGVPYWQATTQADQWLAGSLDLARWKGQNVLVQLVTDSRANNNYDWAYWADLVLSASTTICSYTVPASASIGNLGGSFNANVTATATCSWSTVSNAPWLSVTSGSGSGNGQVGYTAAPNAGPARSGTLTIGGHTLTVNQSGPDQSGCTFAISPASATIAAGGGIGSVSINTTGQCSWTVGSAPSWIVTSSGASGTGIGTWQYTVSANSLGPRSQTVTVAGQSFTLTQAGLVRSLVAGSRSRFDLADAAAANWSAIEAIAGRSYCAQLAAAPTAQAPASPTVSVFRADGTTPIGSAGASRVCFVAPATESVLVKVQQSDSSPRSHVLSVTETTLWANWFYIGGNNSSYTILRNTTDTVVNATITWRAADTGLSVGTKSVAIPPRGIAYYDARPPSTSGAAAAGSVEIAHDGEPQALVGSQTTLSATTGLSFDTILMQRRQQ